MKLLVIGDEMRVKRYAPEVSFVDTLEQVVVPRGTDDDAILRVASDADFIMVDAISPVSSHLIENMPNLKLIHSEGVAYHLIDLDAARVHGVIVCNNRGVNAGAVAEQTILLMLACLRDVVNCDREVRSGRQIQTKERKMVEGIRELGDCRIGFIGFGDIAQATARRLAFWGCDMVYFRRHPLSSSDERSLHTRFENLDTLVPKCDIISLHVPVTEATRCMVDADFISKMKRDAILINTARGEIVDQESLAAALVEGSIAAAGLDTLSPEPVEPENVLLNLPEQAARRIVFSPHIGGITEGMFKRAYRMVWENIARVVAGDEPLNRVR